MGSSSHVVRVFQGAVPRRTVVDFASGLTPEVVRAYSKGQCVSLALALNELTGWPVGIVAHMNPDVVSRVSPRDGLGYASSASLTDPYEGFLGMRSSTKGAASEDVSELLVRHHFSHAVVVSPAGPVDVTGLFSWRDYAESAPASSECSLPGCARACCMPEGLFVVLTDTGIVSRLDQAVSFPGVKVKDRAPAVLQNLDAARELAPLVLSSLPPGLVLARSTRRKTSRSR